MNAAPDCISQEEVESPPWRYAGTARTSLDSLYLKTWMVNAEPRVRKQYSPNSRHLTSNRSLCLEVLLDSCTGVFQPSKMLRKSRNLVGDWVQDHQLWDRLRYQWRCSQASSLCAWYAWCAYATTPLQSSEYTSRSISREKKPHPPAPFSWRVWGLLSQPIRQQWIARSACCRWTSSGTSQC